ncbi:hypothetical protein U7S25_001241 [Providencia rettgeri]|uniref:hypothetical protein n=1 Tax=Providencia TaxID=586 RepID=UPI0009083858|nr:MULTISPECIES: hypothetical protein [Providencia]APC12595.1 hypothetical protein RB151_029370 [Providencia rettgeri]EJD6540383.1 hypothetical protein [Providencia rettgeri]EKH6496606.1 hypothetical protein [Providencia rettgeri]ELQ1455197.1 hypothetical protein [Providencia rettgeri]ELR5052094.1 hypothetical protein [Providencia rettgeri]
MSWKPVVAAICIVLFAIAMIAFGAYRLTDNTCSIDKASLEKRCQKAIDHYKGQQVNY